MEDSLLKVEGLKTFFSQDEKVYHAVDGVSFDIKPGEVVGIVGESGCGKSVTALSILGLISGNGKIEEGRINFEGRDLKTLKEGELRKIRGKDIAMIFQDPLISLNPVYTVEQQISETILAHTKISKKEVQESVIELLRKVEIPAPEKRKSEYPHQLSGGMLQRVMIAMALSMNPKLLIADEPTTALDVTIQAQILSLMMGLREREHMAIMMITHDLGVIAEMADRVVIMYAGKIMESADVHTLFSRPSHPYTCGLLKSLPRLDVEIDYLYVINGVVPDSSNYPVGCRYAERCPLCDKKCRERQPELIEIEKGHQTACFYYNDVADLKNR